MRNGSISATALALVMGMFVPAARGDTPKPVYFPDYVHVQYAGQAGMVSVGPGYSWWHRKVETGASYGYVPAYVADRQIHILSERNTYSPARLRMGRALALEPAVLGVSANFSLGNQYQVFLPKAQRDYYWPDGLYFWMFTGAKLDYLSARPTFFNGMAAQVEVGTVNQYLRTYSENHAVGLGDILSLAVSAQFYL